MIRNMPFAAPPADFADLLPRDAEWFYGELRYRDVFGDAHKTRFCTRVENGELVSDGPPAYHECD